MSTLYRYYLVQAKNTVFHNFDNTYSAGKSFITVEIIPSILKLLLFQKVFATFKILRDVNLDFLKGYDENYLL